MPDIQNYSGDDPTIRLGKRIKLLQQAFPQYANDVKMLTTAAQSPLDDGQLLRQMGEVSGLQAFADTKTSLEAQSLKAQREIFRKMPAAAQASLHKIGYRVPPHDYNQNSISLFGVDLGWSPKRKGLLGTLTNIVESPFAVAAGALHTVKEKVLSPLGRGLNVGYEEIQRQYGAAQAQIMDLGNIQTVYQQGLSSTVNAITRNPIDFNSPSGLNIVEPNYAGQGAELLGSYNVVDEYNARKQQAVDARLQEATYWVDENVRQGNLSEVDAARIMAKGSKGILDWYSDNSDPDVLKGMDRYRAYSGSWGDYARGLSPFYKSQAEIGRSDPKSSYRFEELIHADTVLDGDIHKINLAQRMADGATAESLLAERGVIIGTNEYRSELAKLSDEMNDDKVREVAKTLAATKVGIGADLARGAGFKEGTWQFGVAAGVSEFYIMSKIDPFVVGTHALSALRAARYGIKAAEVATEIERMRNIAVDGGEAYIAAQSGLGKIVAINDVVRAKTQIKAAQAVVDAWNGGERAFYDLMNRFPQISPYISFARKAMGGAEGITLDDLFNAMQTDAGLATVIEGSPQFYRGSNGLAQLPRIDLLSQTTGVIRGNTRRIIDGIVDYGLSGATRVADLEKAASIAEAAGRVEEAARLRRSAAVAKASAPVFSVLAFPARVLRLGIKTPFRQYINLEDMSSIKDMLNVSSMLGYTSAEQASVLNRVIHGEAISGQAIDFVSSQAAARAVLVQHIQGMLEKAGIYDLADKATWVQEKGGYKLVVAKGERGFLGIEGRRAKWANNLLASIGEAYDIHGANLADLASHASPNMRIPNITELARASQNAVFLGRMYRFMNPWWVEKALGAWKSLVTIAPRMGLRAGAEEALTFMLREGPDRYFQALRASTVYAPERVATLTRLADEAEAAGDALRAEELRHEAYLTQKMPGMRAIASGIKHLANKAEDSTVLNMASQFADAIANHTTDVVRRTVGTLMPITDDQIRLGAEMWANDPSVQVLASVIDGRHHSIEAPMAEVGSIAGYMGDNLDSIVDVRLARGRGYEIVKTLTDDPIQIFNRMSQMAQRAGDPFMEQVMQRLAGAHTAFERNQILAGFMGDGKTGKFFKVFQFPDGIKDDEIFDWAISRFKEVIGEVHPEIREDLVKAIRSPKTSSAMVDALEEKIKEARRAGKAAVARALNKDLSEVRNTTVESQLFGKITKITNDNLEKHLPYRQADRALRDWRKMTQAEQQSVVQALTSGRAALAATPRGREIAQSIFDGNTETAWSSLYDVIAHGDVNAEKTLSDGLAVYDQWRKTRLNTKAVREVINGMDLRYRELLTYDGPMYRIQGQGRYAIDSWFKSEVLTDAAKTGLYNNQELTAKMDRSVRARVTAPDGTVSTVAVAKPLAENHSAIYWPIVDSKVSEELSSLHANVDTLVQTGVPIDDAIGQVVDKMLFMSSQGELLPGTSRQKMLMRHMLESSEDIGLAGFRKEAAANGRGMVPLSNTTYANYELADEMHRTLMAGLAGTFVDEGKGVVSTVDILTPKGAREVPWREGGLRRSEFIPADADVVTLPKRVSGSDAYKTPTDLLWSGTSLTPGTPTVIINGIPRPGLSREQAFDDWAKDLAQSARDMFISPDGRILHDVIHGVTRGESDLYARVNGLDVADLPVQSIVPRIFLDVRKKGYFRRVMDFGFSKVVSPMIAGISRQPLFIASLGEGATVAKQWRQGIIALSEKEGEIARTLASRGITYEKVVEAWDSLGPNVSPNVSLKRVMDAFDKHNISLLGEDEARQVRDALSYLTHIKQMERNISYERAFNNVIPFIDDHNIKTFASTYMKGLVPFMYAEEQFLRRWGRTLVQNPFALHRAQMYLGLMRSIGIVHKDEVTGQDMFAYPSLPASIDFMARHIPFVNHFFGGSVHMPDGLKLEQAVSDALPGFRNPGQILPGPVFSIPLTALRHAWGDSKSVADDMIESSTGRRPNDKTWFADVTIGLLPGYAARIVREFLPKGTESTEELARTSIQAMQMIAAEGYAARRKANDAREKGNLKAADRYEAQAQRLLPPTGKEAGDDTLLSGYTYMIQGVARKIMFARAVAGFMGMGTPSIRGEQYEMDARFADYLKAVDPNDPDGFSKALGKFLVAHPDGMPYTVKSTTSASKAPIPLTAGTNAWIDENQGLLKSAPIGGAWLIPPDAGGERDPRVWGRLRALGLYEQRSAKEWAKEFNIAISGSLYYPSKQAFDDAIANLGNNTAAKQELRQRWAEWRDKFMENNPVFSKSQSSREGSDRRTRVVDEIIRLADTNRTPDNDYARSITQMAKSFRAYQDALGRIVGSTKAADAQREDLRLRFWNWGMQVIDSDVALGGFWNGIIMKDAFPDSFVPPSSSTTGVLNG